MQVEFRSHFSGKKSASYGPGKYGICYTLTWYNVRNKTQPNSAHTNTHISDKKHCAKFIFNPLVQTIFVIYTPQWSKKTVIPVLQWISQDGASDTIMVSKHNASRHFLFPQKRWISFQSTILNYTQQTFSFYIQTLMYMPVINTDFLTQIQHRCSLQYLRWLVDFPASIRAFFSKHTLKA